jgi:hypothetical protein
MSIKARRAAEFWGKKGFSNAIARKIWSCPNRSNRLPYELRKKKFELSVVFQKNLNYSYIDTIRIYPSSRIDA